MTPQAGPPPSVAAIDSTPADPGLERDLTELTLIRRLRDNRTTWHRIGLELGMTGPEARRHHKHLTARTRRAWYLQHNQES